MSENEPEELETYGDDYISSYDRKVPKWLIATYIVLPIWGVFCWYFYWNGSYGWLDRGYWNQLQRAANTTFPQINQNDPSQNSESRIQKRRTPDSPF